MLSPSGSEAGPPEGGRKGMGLLRPAGVGGGKERTPGSQEESARQPRLLGPRPGCTWHEVSLEIILVAPPVLGVRCGSDVSWGESSLNPSPWHPSPTPVRGSCPNPQALPAAPSAAQSSSARGAFRRAAPPIPGRPRGDPFPMPWPALSQLLPLFVEPRPLRTSSLPLLPTGSPSSPVTEAAGD